MYLAENVVKSIESYHCLCHHQLAFGLYNSK